MKETISKGVAQMLTGLGIDLESMGMEKTPDRVASLYQDLFKGIHQDTAAIWGDFFETGHEGLVAIHKLPFYSMCEHHLVPFWGTVDIIFEPLDGRVPGFSKLGALVEILSRRPQLQERLTQQLGETLERDLQVKGAFIRIQAEHFCMVMRGEVPLGTKVTTTAAFGTLAKEGLMRSEALSMLQEGGADAK